jgi:hypothetical protein
LIAFVPPALRASLNAGITVNNPSPGGGRTPSVDVGFRSAPLPIAEVETGPVRSGYVIVTPDAGSAAPVSTLTYGMVREGIVQSQAGILPVPLTRDTTVMVDVVQAAGRNLGLAIANPSSTAAPVTLTLRNTEGTVVGSPVSVSISPRHQLARFITELFPAGAIGSTFEGSVTIESPIAVSIIGLRFSGAEFSTVPIPVTTGASVPLSGNVGGVNAAMFPQFALSGGWATTIGLVNTGTATASGRIDVFDPSGNPMPIPLNGESRSTFSYSIPARGSVLFAPRDSDGQSPF